MREFEEIRKELEKERSASLSPVEIMETDMFEFYKTVFVDAQAIYKAQFTKKTLAKALYDHRKNGAPQVRVKVWSSKWYREGYLAALGYFRGYITKFYWIPHPDSPDNSCDSAHVFFDWNKRHTKVEARFITLLE